MVLASSLVYLPSAKFISGRQTQQSCLPLSFQVSHLCAPNFGIITYFILLPCTSTKTKTNYPL